MQLTSEDIIKAINTYPHAINQLPAVIEPVSTAGVLDTSTGHINMYYGNAEGNASGNYVLSAIKTTDENAYGLDTNGKYIAFDVFLKLIDGAGTGDLYLTSESGATYEAIFETKTTEVEKYKFGPVDIKGYPTYVYMGIGTSGKSYAGLNVASYGLDAFCKKPSGGSCTCKSTFEYVACAVGSNCNLTGGGHDWHFTDGGPKWSAYYNPQTGKATFSTSKAISSATDFIVQYSTNELNEKPERITCKSSGTVVTGDKVTISTGNEEGTYTIILYGDTNGDGAISAIDLLNVQKIIINKSNLSGAYYKAADTNKDGKISAIDLLNVQKHILGKLIISQN